MRYILIVLLAAGAAWAAEYEITIYGQEDGGYDIVYTWYAPAPDEARYWIAQDLVGIPSTGEWRLGYHDREDRDLYWQEYAVFHVDSLTEIRPTPAEMEAK